MISSTYEVVRIKLVHESIQEYETRADVGTPEMGADILRHFLKDVDREHFVVLSLNARNHVIGVNVASVGTLTSALVSAREVFKPAILANAASIIVGHNHPSGCVEPSQDDINVTSRLKAVGELMDIPLLDHIIVGEGSSFTSLSRRGYL